jgi:ABC-type sugar transport system ATPase subunit
LEGFGIRQELMASSGEREAGPPSDHDEHGAPALEVAGLHVADKLRDISFSIHRGEIVGVTGLAGSGRTTLLRALFGDVQPSAGNVLLNGKPHRPRSPAKAIAASVYLIPEDRAIHGLVLSKQIYENTGLSVLARFITRLRLLKASGLRRLAAQMMLRLDIRATGPDQVTGELSGGNQQKVVLAKALATGAALLLLDEPTFGVDIGASREIIAEVRLLAKQGTAALWVSSDIRELLEVADRVLVLKDGIIDANIHRGDYDFDEERIIARMQREQFRRIAEAQGPAEVVSGAAAGQGGST